MPVMDIHNQDRGEVRTGVASEAGQSETGSLNRFLRGRFHASQRGGITPPPAHQPRRHGAQTPPAKPFEIHP